MQHAYPLALAALLLAWEGLAGKPRSHVSPATAASSSSSSTSSASASAKGGKKGAKHAVKPPTAESSSESSSSSAAAYSDAPAWYTRSWQLKVFALCGLVAGLLPLMQPHSFVAVGVVTLVTAVCQGLWLLVAAAWTSVSKPSAPSKSDDDAPSATAPDASNATSIPAPPMTSSAAWTALVDAILQWGTFGLVAGGLAFPQMMKHLFHRVSFGQGHSGFVRWNPVWREEGKGLGPVGTWWNALGLFVPLYMLGFLLLRQREQVAFYAGFVALFLVANFIMFQPWHMDNTKVRLFSMISCELQTFYGDLVGARQHHPSHFVSSRKRPAGVRGLDLLRRIHVPGAHLHRGRCQAAVLLAGGPPCGLRHLLRPLHHADLLRGPGRVARDA